MIRARTRLLPAAILLLSGCGDAASGTPDAALDTRVDVVPETDAPSDEVGDIAPEVVDETSLAADTEAAPARCPPGTEGCDSLQWAELEAFPHKSDHHVTFVHTSAAGTWLYVAGGATAKDQSLSVWGEVWRARIDENHLLGTWEAEAALPVPQAFMGLAESDASVYLMGGVSEDADGPFATNTVHVGRFDDEGHRAWSATTSLPAEVRVHPSGHYLAGGGARPGRVVVVGGSSDTPLDSVLYAEVGANGELGPWLAGPTLPEPRSHHAGVVKDGRIWLFGGFTTGQEPLAQILRSTLDGSGDWVGWEAAGTLDSPPWTHAASLYEDGVFLVGGGEGGPGQEHYVDRVRFARWDAGGRLGDFADVHDKLPVARSHVHQAPISDGYLYSVGGRIMATGSSIARVFVAYLAF